MALRQPPRGRKGRTDRLSDAGAIATSGLPPAAAEATRPFPATGSRKLHGRLCTGFLTTLLMTTALTLPGGPAQAQCVTTGTTVTCTGNGTVLDGVIDGVDFLAPPVTTINIFDITGNIAPAAGTNALFAQTVGANESLTISIDTAPFQIISQNASGIFADTSGANSGIDLTNRAAITTQGDGARAIEAATNNVNSPITILNWGAISTQGNSADGMDVDTSDVNGPITISNWGAISTQGIQAEGFNLGTSGDGSWVTFTNWGTITTLGDNSEAISMDVAGVRSPITITNWAAITTQGPGAEGIDVGTSEIDSPITITNNAMITTRGDTAQAIQAETSDSRSPITITNQGVLSTLGFMSHGIEAATDRDNSPLMVENRGAISTTGISGFGILTQTDGDNSPITITNWSPITTLENDSFGIRATARETNSPVAVDNRGAISTFDENAQGIDLSTLLTNSPVTLNNWAPVTTRGFEATAITLATRAAGSPLAFNNWGPVTTTGTSATAIAVSGDSGNTITVNNQGPVTTTGPRSIGIFVQVEDANTSATVTNTADVVTSGVDSTAILAFTDDPSAPVTINLTDSIVQGGSGLGIGINVANVQGTSTLNTSGTVTLSALSGTAVLGGAGNTTINNSGVLTTVTNGAINLGGGTNAFNNLGGGLFNAGPTVDLGAGNRLTNAGIFAPSGTGTLGTTTVTGDFTQTGTGGLATDIRFGSLFADLTNVTGTSVLSGQVVPNIVNPGFVQPGTQQVTILTSTGGVTDAGLTVQDTAVLDYDVLFPDGFSVVLGVTVDFAPTGLNPNQTSVANTFNSIQTAGGSATFAPVVAGLVAVPDLTGLGLAYDQLGPEIYLGNGVAALVSSLDFTDDLMSCKVREGGYALIQEGQCIWAQASGHWLDQERTRETADFDRAAFRFSGGAQAELAEDWRLGLALGYEAGDLDAIGNRQGSQSDTVHAGAVVKYVHGNALVAAAVSGGHGWYDTTRNMAFGGFTGQATASHDISHVTGRLRGAYQFDRGDHYIKPMVDLNVSWVDIGGVTEAGGNGAALSVQGADETVFSVSPAVELGWENRTADGTVLKPYVRAGLTLFDDPAFATVSRFTAAPAGAPVIRTAMRTDDVVGEIAGGIDMFASNGAVFKLFYEGRFGETTIQQSAGIRASMPF